MAKGKAARLKALAQQAATKVNVINRFNETAGHLLTFGERVGSIRRKALAGGGFGAIGIAAGVFFLSFPQSLMLAPLLGVGLGALGALVTPASPSERREDEVRKLLQLIEEAQSRGLTTAVPKLEGHLVDVATSDTVDLDRLLSPPRKQRLLLKGEVAPQSPPVQVLEAELVDEDPKAETERPTPGLKRMPDGTA